MNKTIFANSIYHKMIILGVVSLCVLVEVFPTSGYSSDINLSKTWSYIFGLLSIGVILVSLYFFNSEFSLSFHKSKALLSIYLLLTLANPTAFLFSTYHIVAMLMIWIMYYNAKFYFSEKDKSSFFTTILLSCVASLFYQPLFWLLIMTFIAGSFYSRVDFLRLFAMFLGAFILPFIYIGSYLYLFSDTINIFQYLSEYFIAAVDVQLFSVSFRPEHIIYIVVLGMLILNVTSSIQKRANNLRSIQRAAYRTCFLFLFTLLFISSLFINQELDPLGLFVYLPVSLVLFNYLNNNTFRGWQRILVVLLILLALLYRTSFSLDLTAFV